jgi:hypothetical protein
LTSKLACLHSYVTGNKIYCIYIAPDEETVRNHAQQGDSPPTRCLKSAG